MQLPQVFYYTEKRTNSIISAYHTMHGFNNITAMYPMNNNTQQGSYNFNCINNLLFGRNRSKLIS